WTAGATVHQNPPMPIAPVTGKAIHALRDLRVRRLPQVIYNLLHVAVPIDHGITMAVLLEIILYVYIDVDVMPWESVGSAVHRSYGVIYGLLDVSTEQVSADGAEFGARFVVVHLSCHFFFLLKHL